MSELTPVRRERIQGKLNKLILKNESQESVDQLISVNEINDTQAVEMIGEAKKLRIDTIRRLCMKNVYLGCITMILGVSIAYALLLIIGPPTKPLMLAIGFLEILGLWKIVEGIVGIALASSRKGPIEANQ